MKIADVRAENGAEQQRVNQSMRLQQNNLVNLEAAHGRIMDTDVALESTRLARHSVTVQASAAMVAPTRWPRSPSPCCNNLGDYNYNSTFKKYRLARMLMTTQKSWRNTKMPIVLNTNASATEATFNLTNNDNLRKSIALVIR